MILKKIEIKDFLSIKEATVPFGNSGLVLLEGYDFDLARSNGSGKSSILNALTFCLFDEINKKVSKAEIVRRGTKSCSVTVEFTANNHEYIVTRKKPNDLVVKEDGNVLVITQQELEKKIGCSYEQYICTAYSPQKSLRFIDKGDKEKKEILLEILDFSKFESYSKISKDRLKKVESDILLQKTKLQSSSTSLNILNRTLESLPKVDIPSIEKDILSLQNSIASFSIEAIDQSKYSKLEALIKQKEQDFFNLNSQRMLLLNEMKSLQSKIVPFSLANLKYTSCPSCSVKLVSKGESLLLETDIISMRECHNNQMKEYSKEIELKQEQVTSLNEKLLKQKDLETVKTQLQSSRQADLMKKQESEFKLNRLKSDLQYKINELKSAKGAEDSLLSIKTNIDKVNLELLSINSEIADLSKKSEVLKTVAALFGPTGAPAYVMDSIVDSINDEIQVLMSNLWPNASCILTTAKEKKDGDLAAKISETITINGNPASFGSLSGGEQRGISLIIDFAILGVLEKMFGKTFNPIFLDEPFDSLDQVGKEMVIDILTKMSSKQQIWIVDHSSETKSMFSETVRVEKRDGISKIVI